MLWSLRGSLHTLGQDQALLADEQNTCRRSLVRGQQLIAAADALLAYVADGEVCETVRDIIAAMPMPDLDYECEPHPRRAHWPGTP
ncbi:hypothetical protein [Mycobacterium sp. E3305]|uniref:hypothetical protein n=1 Tax=Mycobacterium sp. E3305 TaxID=1834145 RepID=UPI0007FB9622|nr:hypothetical protein [Mycobacterium sp. E3305]OBG79101.1 hypothetical protein A5701_14460 [Mycobacterium sp. E3305]